MAADCATAVKCNSELATREIDVVFLTHPHAWKRSTGVVAACSEKPPSATDSAEAMRTADSSRSREEIR
jgi:hypothetical protein